MKWDKMGQIGGRGLMSNGGVLVRSVGAKRRCEVCRPLNWVCRIEEKHRGPFITLDLFATPGLTSAQIRTLEKSRRLPASA